MAAVRAYLFIGGGFVRAVCVADFRAENTFKLIKEFLHSPEAATGKPDGFHDINSFCDIVL